MNSNSKKSASANLVAAVELSLDRTVLIGNLIVREASRLAELCEQSKSVEPLQRMAWILEDATEQIGNQMIHLEYGCHINDKETTQDGGQGDE